MTVKIFNGFTEYEITTRNHIKELVVAGMGGDAEQLARKFMTANKRRRRHRWALMRTIPGIVALLNKCK